MAASVQNNTSFEYLYFGFRGYYYGAGSFGCCKQIRECC